MEPAAQAHWSWLGEFVRRCQVCVDKHASISDATWIVSALPRSTPTFAQHLIIRSVLTDYAFNLSTSISREPPSSSLDLLRHLATDCSGIESLSKTFVAFVQLRTSQSSASPVRHIDDPRVEAALRHIERRYAETDIRLAAIAREIGVSASRLTTLLKEQTGFTFEAHIHSRRVQEAQRLLRSTKLSIKEIARRIGYRRTSELDRHFRRAVGTTPCEYRAARSGR